MKRKPYPAYKPSGEEWLGDVPEHWVAKKIKWNTPVLRGASPRPIDDQIYFDDDGEYAWVRIADVTASHVYLNDTTQRLSDIGANLSVKLNPGSLFLSIAATVGVPCIAGIRCCIHDGFVHFPSLRADVKFMFYMFACGEPYKGLGKLGTQLNLNTDIVGSIKVAFPTLPEQQSIATFLDRETGRIDILVAKKYRLIELLREKRSALISHAVTRGLDPSVKLKPSGVEWLGDVPEHWDVKRLKYSTSINDETLPETTDPEYEILYIDIGSINPVSGIKEKELMLFENAPSRARRIVRHGDTIVSTVRTYLRAIAPVKNAESNLVVSTGFAVIRPCTIENDFLAFALRAPHFIDTVVSRSVGVSYPAINASEIGHIEIPIPTLREQQAIAAFLDRETGKIDALIAKVEAALEKLKEYRTALISAVVTGKIDVREAA